MDEQIPSPEYVEGFNEGYAIQKKFPDLANQVVEQLTPSEHTDGFKDGRQQFLLEQEKTSLSTSRNIGLTLLKRHKSDQKTKI